MVCLFAIFRGFVNSDGTSDGTRTSGEHNEVYLGFSRDGFNFWRQYDGTPVEGGERPRKPFMPQTWPRHSWRYTDVQGSGGGFVYAPPLGRGIQYFGSHLLFMRQFRFPGRFFHTRMVHVCEWVH